MPGLDTLKLFANHAPHHLFRFAIDWNKQKALGIKAVHLWEEREPNSLKAVLDAYAYVVPIIENKQRFNLDDICNIHYLCTHNVELVLRTNADNKIDIEQLKTTHSGVIRGFGPWCGGILSAYGLSQKTCSERGWEELKESFRMGDIYFPMYTVQQSQLESRDDFLSGPHQIFGYMAGFTPNEIMSLENDIQTVQLMESWFSDDASLLVVKEKMTPHRQTIEHQLERWKTNFTRKLNEILNDFYERIEVIPDENINAKLTAIVSVIQRFERIHPFFDANIRTFVLVLLNALLMQYGFEPALIDDPNKFDGFAVDELIDLVKQGMRRTTALSRHLQRMLHEPLITAKNIPKWMSVPLDQHAYLTEIALPLVTLFQPKAPTSLFSNPGLFFSRRVEMPRAQEQESMAAIGPDYYG